MGTQICGYIKFVMIQIPGKWQGISEHMCSLHIVWTEKHMCFLPYMLFSICAKHAMWISLKDFRCSDVCFRLTLCAVLFGAYTLCSRTTWQTAAQLVSRRSCGLRFTLEQGSVRNKMKKPRAHFQRPIIVTDNLSLTWQKSISTCDNCPILHSY